MAKLCELVDEDVGGHRAALRCEEGFTAQNSRLETSRIKMKVDTRANQKKVPSKLLLEKKTGSVVAADV